MALVWALFWVLCFGLRARAELPWGGIRAGDLQGTKSGISFDPLALLAILHNPRASTSAARLYNQRYPDIYRWPHTAMVGAALTPFKLLVDHLASETRSIHPTMELFKADTGNLPILSNIGFDSLPLMYSNFWLADLLEFRPSKYPLNDIMIVCLESIHGKDSGKGSMSTTSMPSPGLRRALLYSIEMLVIFSLITGLVCSVLEGDIWATTLFSTYLLHNVMSTIVSFRTMVSTNEVEGRRIREDETIKFAVYQRPSGGKIVFKARQDTLETWARMSWKFQRNPLNDILHWAWMTTGSLSAVASVICMVNMAGNLQLAYFGVLVVSSGCEIGVTQLVRRIQHTALRFGAWKVLPDNETWSKAVIRAALEVDKDWSLADLPWIDWGLFPKDLQVFQNLCSLLPKLRDKTVSTSDLDVKTQLSVNVSNARDQLVDRIVREISAALDASDPKTK